MSRLAVLAALTLAPVAAVAAQDADLVGLDTSPNVRIDFYDVIGTDPRQIRASLDRQRIADPADGNSVEALTQCNVEWRWMRDENGGCRPETAEVRYGCSVRLPRLADETALSDRDRARWHAYLAALALHETGHVRNVADRVPALQASLRAASCATIQGIADATLAEINRYDADYDAQTAHGQAQGAVYP